MSSRKLGESPAKEKEDQAEHDGYSAGKYAGDDRITEKMRREHENNAMEKQAFERGYERGKKDRNN
ncbi:hypothetical protein [Alteromonas sp. a30]|uniref:hypothetical protein n=1 Tax=Alteromonas sp. a30 TaxID=2730917 RepID=UPI00227E00E7|nr:hypothetical protein [Alteromonas sp. a30]MCY7294888.1 hypothetical protein [Alteromonas sp. a30]